jgi:hypothetical protein
MPIIPFEQQIELARQDLASQLDFTTTAAFHRFAPTLSAKLSEQDIYYGLQLLGIQCDLADARLFVDRYD